MASSSSRSITPTLIERATEVDEYYKFQVEDTAEGCYRDFCLYLQNNKGWKRMPVKKKSKLLSKLPPRKDEVPLLYCVLNDKDVDFTTLQSHQVCNHYEGMGRTLTTKSGFCDLLRDMSWSMVDANTIAPRSYNLGDPVHREEFIDDFKLSAAINVLKFSLENDVRISSTSRSAANCNRISRSNSGSSSGTISSSIVSPTVLKSAMKACSRYLRIKVAGEWPGVEKDFKADDKSSNLGDTQWSELLETSYLIADKRPFTFNFTRYLEKEDVILKSDISDKKRLHLNMKLWFILKAMRNVNSNQMSIDGTKNIWIIKAPEACKGVGIKLLYKLNDILDCEKGMGGRTAQKYIENPLLVPFCKSHACSSGPNSISPRDITSVSPTVNPSGNISVKFDLRVWVLVTSITPLRVKIFSKVYGRCCCSQYDDETGNLADTSMHLTNFAIQKNHAQVENSNGNNVDNVDSNCNNNSANGIFSTGVTSVLNRLRASVKKSSSSSSSSSERDAYFSSSSTLYKGDLLLTHEDVVHIVASASSVNKTWDGDVWPEIKSKIMQTLQAVCCSGNVTHRNRSFEFLGFDVMLDDNLNPWILEINMSPALAHRGGRHSGIIAHMASGIVDTAIITHTGTPVIEKQSQHQQVFQGQDGGVDETSSEALTETETETHCSDNGSDFDYGEWQDLEIADKTCLLAPHLIRNVISEGINNSCEKSSMISSSKSLRPMSAGKVRPSQKQAVKVMSDWDDVHYTAPKPPPATPIEIVGKLLVKPSVRTLDRNLEILEKMRLIQAWFRRFLVRNRRYHRRRYVASTLMQRVIRGFIGKSRLWHLRRGAAITTIQCKYRCCLANKKRVLLRQCRCALIIQCRSRIYRAKLRRYDLFLNAKAVIIQIFLIRSIDRWYRKAARRIVQTARSWCKRRWTHARVVRSMIVLYYRRRQRHTKVIQRFIRRCFVRWRLFETMKKLKLKSLAEEAVVVVEEKVELKLIALREQERDANRIREDVICLINEMITTTESKDLDDKKERMTSDNSGFLFDFVDRYENDRRKIHSTLSHTLLKNLMIEKDECGYEFENAPPTSLDHSDHAVGVRFGVSFSVKRADDTHQLGVSLQVNKNNSSVSTLSRIGAEVIEKKVKEKARDQTVASKKAKRRQLLSHYEPETNNDPNIPTFLDLSSQKRLVEQQKHSSSSSRRRSNEQVDPSPFVEKKKISKKKKPKSTAPVVNIFDTSRPPDFMNLKSVPQPPAPSFKPSNVPRPESKHLSKENTRPFFRSSPGNRRTEFVSTHKRDYLEALSSLNKDLDAAAAHYSHHGISLNHEVESREPLTPLYLSNSRNSKKESAPDTSHWDNIRPEFVVNRKDYDKSAKERLREREAAKKRDVSVSRPRSAGATRKQSSSISSNDRPKSANRRIKSATIRNNRSDHHPNISFDDKYRDKNILESKHYEENSKNDCIFPGIRTSFDYSAFKPPSFDSEDLENNNSNHMREEMCKPPIVPPLEKRSNVGNGGNGGGSGYQYEDELKRVLFRIA